LQASAYCFGAATIINGIPLGLGAAFGIALKTEAKVVLTNEPNVYEVTIKGDEDENQDLAKFSVIKVLKKFGLENEFGAKITTESNIPISRGLKSSSCAANSIVLATFGALKEEYTDMEVIELGIEASILAQVTLTGAFDDSCAAYFGDVVVTDNLNFEILSRYPIEQDYDVIIHVPDRKIRKSEVNIQKLKGIRDTLKSAHDMALEGNFLEAMMINGKTYANAMGLDNEIAQKAIAKGASSAAITGCGPATVILAKSHQKDNIISSICSEGKIILTKINNKSAGLL
jgi:shikimate kinase